MVQREREISYYFKVINDQMVMRWNRDLKPYDLTASQFDFIVILYEHGGEMPLRDIQREKLVSQPTIAGISSRLEKKGLIKLVTDQNDKRAKIAQLTQVGEERARLFHQKGVEASEWATASLSSTQKDELIALLKQIFSDIGEQKEGGK